jgi:hypothetical protein
MNQPVLSEICAAHGVRFRYPEDWELTEQRDGNDVTLTVSSPESSFWSLSLYRGKTTLERVIETAVDAFREVYPELDIYPADETLGDRPTAARDLEFVACELINGAFLRAAQLGPYTALVLYQGTDQELTETLSVMELISATLEADDEADQDAAETDDWDE